MGNCISNKPLSGKSAKDQEALDMLKRKLLDNDGTLKSSNSTSIRANQVKIKITKRELEKLLGKVDVEELPITELLSRLINVSDGLKIDQRSWRPSLQSIPEVN